MWFKGSKFKAGAAPKGRLGAEQWFDAIADLDSQRQIVSRVARNQPSPWIRRLIKEVGPGSRVLEIGSGTGEMSLFLARAGADITMLDFSKGCLALAKACASQLQLEVEVVQANYECRLPFADQSFDLVFSSGVLEHYTPEDQIRWLREQARVSRHVVVSLVPNSSSLAYRLGKERLERRGEWSYGIETPMATQTTTFAAAGMNVLTEETIGSAHSLSFLPRTDRLRWAMRRLIKQVGEEQMNQWGQGYLLFTLGSVRPS